jgi:hypothetical protein
MMFGALTEFAQRERPVLFMINQVFEHQPDTRRDLAIRQSLEVAADFAVIIRGQLLQNGSHLFKAHGSLLPTG